MVDSPAGSLSVTQNDTVSQQQRLLAAGAEFTLWSRPHQSHDGQLQSTRVYMYLTRHDATQQQHLCWRLHAGPGTGVGADGSETDATVKQIAINTISDMSQGKVNAEFKAIKNVPSDCSMSISSKSTNTTLHLQCSSRDMRDIWWQALVHAVKTSGKTVRSSSSAVTKSKSGRSTPVTSEPSFDLTSSPAPANTQPSLAPPATVRKVDKSNASADSSAALIDKVRAGALFYKYDVVNNVCNRSEVYLYTSGIGRQGTLLWCTLPTGTISNTLSKLQSDGSQYHLYKQKRADGELCFAHLTDMLLRKRTTTLHQAAAAKDECCMSLLTQKYTLNIEAISRAQLLEWKEGLISTIAASGRQMLRSTPSSNTRAINELVIQPKQLTIAQQNGTRTASTPDLHLNFKPHQNVNKSADNSANSSPLNTPRMSGTAPYAANANNSNNSTDDVAHLRRAASTPTNAHNSSTVVDTDISVAALTQVMCAGQEFTLYYTNLKSNTIEHHQVFVHVKLQPVFRMYWSNPKLRTESERQSILLSKVIELTTGRSSPSLKQQAVAEECCLVIITPGGTLSLVAPNVQIRKHWLSGLHHLLISNGKKLLNSESTSSKQAVATQPSTPLAPPLSTTITERAQRICAQISGVAHNVTLYTMLKDTKTVNSVKVYMYMQHDRSADSSPGYLHWTSNAARDGKPPQTDAGSRFLLRQLAEMSAGADADLLKTEPGQRLRLSADVLATLLSLRNTSGQYLHMSFQSTATRELWMNCIHELMLLHIQPAVTPGHRHSISHSEPVRMRSILNSNNDHVQANTDRSMLVKGQVFTIHTATASDVYFFFCTAVDDTSVPNMLFWCEPGERKQDTQQSVRISDIVSIEQGSSMFAAGCAHHAVNERSWSIHAGARTMCLEAFTLAVRDKWLHALRALIHSEAHVSRLANSGNGQHSHSTSPRSSLSISTNDDTVARQSINSPSVMSPQQNALAVNILQTGQIFNMYQFDAASTRHYVQSVQVWFVTQAHDDAPGCLFWCPSSQPRTQSKQSSLHLSTVRMLYAGKTTPVLQSSVASQADDDCCMTIASDNIALNLEATTPYARETFIRALHNLLTRSGMKAVESANDDDTSDAVTSTNSSSLSSQKQPAGNPNETVAYELESLSNRQQLSHTSRTAMNRTINFTDPTDKLQLQVKIGEGSYGSVWRAVDLRDSSSVAVKILQDLSDMQPLRKEIKILRSCQNPYIVGYKGAYQRRGALWIVMEYCAGGSLGDLMQLADRCLAEREIAAVMKMALHGLAYLHGTGRIHRDIKACNLLLSHTGMVKLADFGVSGTLDRTLGRKLTVIGTPHWMAPEVLLSDEYDCKADVWSLGITAYELCVGEPPHANLHSMRAALKIPICPPPTLPEPHRWTPQFHSFIEACCIKEPDNRPSADQLLSHPFIVNAPQHTHLTALADIAIQASRAKQAKLEQQPTDNTPSTARTNPIGTTAARLRLAASQSRDDNFDDSDADHLTSVDIASTSNTVVQHNNRHEQSSDPTNQFKQMLVSQKAHNQPEEKSQTPHGRR